MLKGKKVELPAMLDAREERARLQKEFSAMYHAPLLSFSLNIPGPVKTNDQLRLIFDEAVRNIKERIGQEHATISKEQEKHTPTGDEYLMAFDGDPQKIKATMTAIEESHPLGRLYDIDILTKKGEKISRPTPRHCLLCNNPAQVCARSRHHSIEELTTRIQEMLDTYLR